MRARRRTQPDSGAPSLDSFLDVVTNLVGILIILIMVVGVTARDALVQAASQLISPTEESAPTLSIEPTPPREEVADEEMLRRHRALVAEVEGLSQQIHSVDQETQGRQNERNQLQLLLSAAKQSLEEVTQQLDEKDQTRIRGQQDLMAEQTRLDKLYDQIESLQNYQPEVRELAHYATPLAKTVFGEEEHFRLSGGRLTYVPINQLVELMKQEAAVKARQMGNRDTITSTIGPLSGFMCEYTLRRVGYERETSMGTATRQGVELDHFMLQAERPDMGETIEQALRPGSRFREVIGTFDPDRTTITVWTYPDSFHTFRDIKEDLFDLGFSTAARPLPEGHPIGGSPRGQRSASQ